MHAAMGAAISTTMAAATITTMIEVADQLKTSALAG
jgi:hypothetical protein